MQPSIALAFGVLALTSNASALLEIRASNTTRPLPSSSTSGLNDTILTDYLSLTTAGPRKSGVNPLTHFTLPGPLHLKIHTSPVAPSVGPTDHGHLRDGISPILHSDQKHSTIIPPAGNVLITVTTPCPTCPVTTVTGSNSRTTIYTCPPVTTPGPISATTVYKACPTCLPIIIPGSGSIETVHKPCLTCTPTKVPGSISTTTKSNIPATVIPTSFIETTITKLCPTCTTVRFVTVLSAAVTKTCSTCPPETVTPPPRSTVTITKLCPTCHPVVPGPATGPNHVLTVTKLCPICPPGTVVTSTASHVGVSQVHAPVVFGYHEPVYTNSTANDFGGPSIFASDSDFHTEGFTSTSVVLITITCNGKVIVETQSAGVSLASHTAFNGEVTVETQSPSAAVVSHTGPNGQITVETQPASPSNGETNEISPSHVSPIAASQVAALQSDTQKFQATAAQEVATQAVAPRSSSSSSNAPGSNSPATNAPGSANQAAANVTAANPAVSAQKSPATATIQASASQKAAEASEINSPSATDGTSPSSSVKVFQGAASSFKASTAIVSFAVAGLSFVMFL